jgi:hypothetical protein
MRPNTRWSRRREADGGAPGLSASRWADTKLTKDRARPNKKEPPLVPPPGQPPRMLPLARQALLRLET